MVFQQARRLPVVIPAGCRDQTSGGACGSVGPGQARFQPLRGLTCLSTRVGVVLPVRHSDGTGGVLFSSGSTRADGGGGSSGEPPDIRSG